MAYIIRHTEELQTMETGRVAVYPWGGDYRPEVLFKIGWTEEGLHVHLRSYEEHPVATVLERNGPVCTDSCMEFFFSPSADNSAGYFNFEINPHPTLLLHYGPTPAERSPVMWPEEDFCITCTQDRTDAGRGFWQLDYFIPFAMIRRYVPDYKPEKGSVLRANLYKCGSNHQPDHYGVWNSIDPDIVPRPNFHTPTFFGEMVLA